MMMMMMMMINKIIIMMMMMMMMIIIFYSYYNDTENIGCMYINTWLPLQKNYKNIIIYYIIIGVTQISIHITRVYYAHYSLSHICI